MRQPLNKKGPTKILLKRLSIFLLINAAVAMWYFIPYLNWVWMDDQIEAGWYEYLGIFIIVLTAKSGILLWRFSRRK